MYDGSVKRSLGLCVVVVKDKEGKRKQLVFEVLKTRHHTSLNTCLQLELLSYRLEKVNLVAEHSPLTKEKVLMEFGDETEAMARHDHNQKLFKLLQRAQEVNLKFNKDKMRLHQTELLF